MKFTPQLINISILILANRTPVAEVAEETPTSTKEADDSRALINLKWSAISNRIAAQESVIQMYKESIESKTKSLQSLEEDFKKHYKKPVDESSFKNCRLDSASLMLLESKDDDDAMMSDKIADRKKILQILKDYDATNKDLVRFHVALDNVSSNLEKDKKNEVGIRQKFLASLEAN